MSHTPVPQAGTKVHIFQTPPNVMQAGRGNGRTWLLEFQTDQALFIEPLMGWTGSTDTRRQVTLEFPSCESAVAFAARHGYAYSVRQPEPHRRKPRSYADDIRLRERRGELHK